ncbi:TIGR01458 family HAD-type hydrolase [Zobellella maritima]|uniref:TIGR01458 family HAD-type hydrolase n=1 Tax=Zobellella maritima TaxID=2059725 RepID=UPI000E308475|nr:TIGR01458 family HAD-type hydrolase [Zobellella maritima]
MKALHGIQGILLDLEGVLYVGERAIDGAVDTIKAINDRQIPHRYVTNTTTLSRVSLSQKLQAMGFAVEPHEILSAPAAACVHLRQRQPRSCYFAVSEAIREEFREFPISDTPDALVIGDIGRAWTYDLVNHLFQMVMAGADIVALHKGKYWQTPDGLRVDIGAFIAGLEYATGVDATVIGKPSPAFFQAAARELRCPAESILMVGDDIDSDVGGAQQCGIRGVLVKTGKYRPERAAASAVVPDAVIDSIARLMRYL